MNIIQEPDLIAGGLQGMAAERARIRAMLRSEEARDAITDAIAMCTPGPWGGDDFKRAEQAAKIAIDDIIAMIDKPPSQP